MVTLISIHGYTHRYPWLHSSVSMMIVGSINKFMSVMMIVGSINKFMSVKTHNFQMDATNAISIRCCNHNVLWSIK
jgi:hypothetical protein